MRLLRDADVVLDVFDNSAARQAVFDACAATDTPCLHAGLSPDYAEVIWNERYRVPSDAHDDVCDYPLARNLVMLTVSVLAEVVIGFATTEQRRGFALTLGDLKVSRTR